VEVYQICAAYFSQVMHFIVTWVCAVRRGKGTGHPTSFNSRLSTPRGGGMGCAVCVVMSVCLCVHGCVCMRIWCRHCMRIQPAFGLITVHTYIRTYSWEGVVKTKEYTIRVHRWRCLYVWRDIHGNMNMKMWPSLSLENKEMGLRVSGPQPKKFKREQRAKRVKRLKV
jgi:hypothetical protein